MSDASAVRLDRVLHALPLAMRRGGATLDELAETLGCKGEDVLRDLNEVTARAYYHASGASDQLQILVEGDRVQVWTPGEFQQPVRLSQREGLALSLGLRILAAESPVDRRASILALAQRLEAELSVPQADHASGVRADPSPHAAGAPSGDTRDRSDVMTLDVGDDGFRSAIADAAIERHRCRLLYLKPGQASPVWRDVAPYVLIHGSGSWYVLGHDAERDAVRAFRMDRILAAEPTAQSFAVPADFDAGAFVGAHGLAGVYQSPGDEVEVHVRYSPRVARWISERMPCVAEPDGSVVALHRVADPRWIVRHVLQYGEDACVVEPASVRERVANAALQLSA